MLDLDTPNMEERVRLTRIRTFFGNARGNPLAMIAGALVLAVFFHEGGSEWRGLALWAAPTALLGFAVFLFERHVSRMEITAVNAPFLLRVRMVLGVLVSALFGASVLLIPEANVDTPALYGFIVVTTVATVGYMAYATMFSYCLATNVVAVVPYVVVFFYRYASVGDRFALLVGVTSLVWHVIVISKAWSISRSAVGEIYAVERLRQEMEERQQVEHALRSSEDNAQQLATMLRLLCDNVPDMIWAKDLDNRFLFVNKAYAERLLGAPDTSEPIGRRYGEYFARDRAKRPDDPVWHTLGEYSEDVDRHTLSREEPTVFEEVGTVRGRNVYLDMHQARFVDHAGEVIGTVGCARDITERKASEAYVRHLAHHDVLTDLPNRLLLSDRLRIALAQARRDRGKLALLFMDLDNLKPVNDTLGHDVGDMLLKEVAVRLNSVVSRESDTVARLGGDEFVILLARINRDQDAGCVADRILEALAVPLHIAGHEIRISASLGVALYPLHAEDAGSLLRHADSAMYAAKRAGRNTFRVYLPAQHES